MRCPALPDSSGNSGPAREKRISASPARADAADPCRLRPRAGAHVARQRGAGIGLEPREQRIEIAPMDAFGGELRFAVGQRRERAITECGDKRENRQRDQELDQRKTARAGRIIACRLPEESRQPGENVAGLRGVGDDDLDLAKRRIGRARYGLAPRRTSCSPARRRRRARPAQAKAVRAAPTASRFWATHSASVRCFSSVAASADCATARIPAVSATARTASATSISTRVKPLAPRIARGSADRRRRARTMRSWRATARRVRCVRWDETAGPHLPRRERRRTTRA